MKKRIYAVLALTFILGLSLNIHADDDHRPDLFVSEFSITPATPVQGEPVAVRIGVYNRGNQNAGPFIVQWWAGESFGAPAQTWYLDRLSAHDGTILTFAYNGYQSSFPRLRTKVIVDMAGEVSESEEGNNAGLLAIRVHGQQARPLARGTTLTLISLECHEPEDADVDEPEIIVVSGGDNTSFPFLGMTRGSVVTGAGRSIGQVSIDGRTSIILYDRDNGRTDWWDSDDYLGAVVIPGDVTNGIHEVTFRGDGANYVLRYRVN